MTDAYLKTRVFNQDYDCVKAQHNIGSTEYRDICQGSSKVLWGTLDWYLFIVVASILGAIVGSVFVRLQEDFSDWWRRRKS